MLVYSTNHDSVVFVVVMAVELVVLTVCGDAPATGFVWSTRAVPVQSAVSKSRNRTLPARLPAPAATVIVAESFGTNDCAVAIVGVSEITVVVSPLAPHTPATPSVFGESPE